MFSDVLKRAFKPQYNDIDLEIDQPTLDMLQAHGIDDLLARHIAHLFVRDPLVIYNESIYVDDKENTNHFEVFRLDKGLKDFT